MKRPRLEVAEVFRSCQDEYFQIHSAALQQRRVFQDIIACRTAVLGGHVRRCDQCGHEQISYNSCRNRHCPKCQAKRQADWLQAQADDLLDVPYFHVVFTLPDQLGPLALQNQPLLYHLLFRAASETLLTIARDPKQLGAKIGFLAILHTWGQNLLHHPHLHCVVPAGGLSPDDRCWVSSRKGFFLPVRVLSRLFQKKFLAFLRHAFRQKQLIFEGQLQHLALPSAWRDFLKSLRRIDWVVYSKPPFGSPQRVLKYLARYTHRVAISNRRLVALEPGRVTFRYKDYRNGNRPRTMTLSAVEFTRRFLLHVLPQGFVRIRHYGFLANRSRRDKLHLCRQHLAPQARLVPPLHSPDPVQVPLSPAHDLCPACHKGQMLLIEKLPPTEHRIEPRMNSPDYQLAPL